MTAGQGASETTCHRMSAKASTIQALVAMLCDHPNDTKLVMNACRKLVWLLNPANRDAVANPAFAPALEPAEVFCSAGGLAAVVAMLRSWPITFPDPTESGIQALCELACAALSNRPKDAEFAASTGVIDALLSIIPGKDPRERVLRLPTLPYGVRQGVMHLLCVLSESVPRCVLESPLILLLPLSSMQNSSEYEQEWAMKSLSALLRYSIRMSLGVGGPWTDALGVMLGPAWTGISLSTVCTCIISVLRKGLPHARAAAAQLVQMLLVGDDTPMGSVLCLDAAADAATRAIITDMFVAANGASALSTVISTGTPTVQGAAMHCLASIVQRHGGVVHELLREGSLTQLCHIFDNTCGPVGSTSHAIQTHAALLLWRVLDAARQGSVGMYHWHLGSTNNGATFVFLFYRC